MVFLSTYIWLIFYGKCRYIYLNVGKYTIHGCYGDCCFEYLLFKSSSYTPKEPTRNFIPNVFVAGLHHLKMS